MKLAIYIGATIGGALGAYIPVLFFHADSLSGWSLFLGFVGTIVGLWAGYKFGQYVGE